VPHLLRWLQQEPRHWGYTIHNLARRLPTGRVKDRAYNWALRRETHESIQDARQRFGTLEALRILSTEAAPSIPELTRSLNQTIAEHPDSMHKIIGTARALGAIGKEGLPPLLAATTNHPERRYARCWVLGAIGDMGTNARPAVPALLNLLNDQDSLIREEATNDLRRIAPEALWKAPPK
jgi:HEAT repeat protein